MIQSMKLRGALVLLAVGIAPEAALADARWCTWTNTTVVSTTVGATLRCYADAPCTNASDCGSGRICGEGGTCMPPCTTIRLAAAAGDCTGTSFVRLSGTPPRIEVAAGAFAPTGYCSSIQAGPTCGSTPSWAAWEQSYMQTETTPFGEALQHTNVWGAADSDVDGCQDGGDPSVCVTSSPSSCSAPATPNSCSAGEVEGICCANSSTLHCGDCDALDCSTIRACSPDAQVWTCPPLAGGANGACLRNDENPLPLEGLNGVCLFPEFLRGCLAPGLPDMSAACFTSPATGEGTTNFFDGDCDGDGCPNGHDAQPCLACDGEWCRGVSVDPRVPCRSLREVIAGELIDPPSCQPDAGVVDAGMDAAMDASTIASPDAGRVTFGGGGGCSCRAGNSGRSAFSTAWGLLGLLWAAARRRSRV